MTEVGHTANQEAHRQFSGECFNKCWSFIDKPARSAKEVEEMLLLAHASLWHWMKRTDCKPMNLSVGYWQVSRVYALAGHGELAKLFGEICLKIASEHKLGPFYVGYGYEALARAELTNRNGSRARELLAKARSELQHITDKEEQDALRADVSSLEKTIPSS